MAALNGRLNTRFLVVVDGKLFSQEAAPYFQAMFDDMEADGVGRPVVRHGYRDYDTQVAMREEYGTGAAWPGDSNHGWGLSADLASGPAPHWYALTRAQLAWLRKNAEKYGIHEDVADESWHWTFKGNPTINLEERNDMTPEQSRKLDAVHAALVGENSRMEKMLSAQARIDKRTQSMQKFAGEMGRRLVLVAEKLGLKS